MHVARGTVESLLLACLIKLRHQNVLVMEEIVIWLQREHFTMPNTCWLVADKLTTAAHILLLKAKTACGESASNTHTHSDTLEDIFIGLFFIYPQVQ